MSHKVIKIMQKKKKEKSLSPFQPPFTPIKFHIREIIIFAYVLNEFLIFLTDSLCILPPLLHVGLIQQIEQKNPTKTKKNKTKHFLQSRYSKILTCFLTRLIF